MSLAGATGAINSQYFLFAKNYWFCWLQVARLKPSFNKRNIHILALYSPLTWPEPQTGLTEAQRTWAMLSCSVRPAASALEVNYAVTWIIVNQWSNHDKYWCSCSCWHLELWRYTAALLLLWLHTLCCWCVSTVHYTAHYCPLCHLSVSGPGPATAGYLPSARSQVPAPAQHSVQASVRGQSPVSRAPAQTSQDCHQPPATPAQASQATVPAHQHLF